MSMIQVTLPDTLREFVEEQAARGGHGTPEEYVCALIRSAQKDTARRRLEALLLEGLEGEPVEVTEVFWDELRREVRERHPNSRDDSQ